GIGDTVTYRIDLTNAGTATITAVDLVDTVSDVLVNVTTDQPASTLSVTPTTGGTIYAWSAMNLTFRPGDSVSFTITGQVRALCQTTTVSNTAYVVLSTACPSSSMIASSNVTSFIVALPAAGLTVVKTQAPASPAPGQPVTYGIVVTNTGAATVTSLTVVDTISPVVTSVTTDDPPPFAAPVVSQAGSGTRYVWSAVGLSLVPGASFTFTLTGVVGAVYSSAAVCNTAVAEAVASCATVSAQSNVVSFDVTPILELTITSATSYDFLMVTGGSVNVSGTTFDILNSGNVPATLTFSLSNTLGAWIPVATGAPGFNEFELDAQMNFPSSPALWTAVDHALRAAPPGPDASSGSRFAGNETGLGVTAGSRRHLWVRLMAPSSTNQATKQRFVISITAVAP
ncbi:MAG: hypothetical protein AAB368_08525, partial [bacterium]